MSDSYSKFKEDLATYQYLCRLLNENDEPFETEYDEDPFDEYSNDYPDDDNDIDNMSQEELNEAKNTENRGKSGKKLNLRASSAPSHSR